MQEQSVEKTPVTSTNSELIFDHRFDLTPLTTIAIIVDQWPFAYPGVATVERQPALAQQKRWFELYAWSRFNRV